MANDMQFMQTMSHVERQLYHDLITTRDGLAKLQAEVAELKKALKEGGGGYGGYGGPPAGGGGGGGSAPQINDLRAEIEQSSVVQDLQKKILQLDSRISQGPATITSSVAGAPDAQWQKSFEDRLWQQAKELSNLKNIVTDVHASLPLHAVRASRIALRSTELSKEDRRLALASLDKKEAQIRAEVDNVANQRTQPLALGNDGPRMGGGEMIPATMTPVAGGGVGLYDDLIPGGADNYATT